jgi:hypothetical protein
MADKIVWVLGREDEWAVRLEGKVIAAGLSEAEASHRAWKVAEFIQEGHRSAEIRRPAAGGGWTVLPGPIPMSSDPAWFTQLRRFA